MRTVRKMEGRLAMWTGALNSAIIIVFFVVVAMGVGIVRHLM